ncbi:MAG: endonuclease/exonuclease/phosphatase family protein [Pseudomonadota bacterium]|nr:endonuclease/exonuclease/phosphatase family protein [Pseudomonadota bacterium]
MLTYNIHKGFSMGNTRFVLHQIRDALELANVDLIFLQEIQGNHSGRRSRVQGWPDAPQFEFLASRLWPHYAYGKNAIYHQGDHGNAILSKYPFISWENINVSPSRYASRSVLHGVIEGPGSQHIHVICIHFGLIPSEQHGQLAILNERIHSHVPSESPLIIAGDFNDWTGHAERLMQTRLGVVDVFKTLTKRPARTFPVWCPVLPIDRIFYRGAIAEACKCFSKLPWRRLSDHAALYASFLLPMAAGSEPPGAVLPHACPYRLSPGQLSPGN